MGVIESAKRFFKTEQKPSDDGTKFTKIENLEQAANYLQAVKDQADRGDSKIDVTITTATSPERRMFLNYAIKQMSDKLKKYKILLFLRVNPIHIDAATGRETYLSKLAIANALSKLIGRRILEDEIDAEENKAVQYCFQAIASCRQNKIPLVGEPA